MIKRYKQFINEISGTELVGPVGPAYGETGLQNKTMDHTDTDVIYSEINGRIYTQDEWNDIYGDYLKMGGEPVNGYNKENLEKVIFFLNNNKNDE